MYWEELPNWKKNKFTWKDSQCKFIYDNIEGKINIIDYVGQMLYIKYLDEPILRITIGHFKECKIGKLLGKYTYEFKVNIGDSFIDHKRNITIINRKYINVTTKKYGKQKWYNYTCNKCGWTEGWMVESELISGTGCSCCCNPIRTIVVGINDIPTTAPWMVKYFQGGYDEAKLYTKGSGQKIRPICPDCKRVKNKLMSLNTINKKKSIACICGDSFSYPTKLMFNILAQLGLEFTTEYSPQWANGKFYDFYISNHNLIIEMDGALGHGKNVHPKSKNTKDQDIANDNSKDEMAINNNLEIIRINCIKSDIGLIKQEILSSRLSKIFEFSKIDWKDCEAFALSNRVKEICEIKRLNPIMDTLEISIMTKTNRSTVIDYLKKGHLLGWCNYVPIAGSGREVSVFKDSVFIGSYINARDLERRAESELGLKIDYNGIRRVCNGITKEYKGLVFKFT